MTVEEFSKSAGISGSAVRTKIRRKIIQAVNIPIHGRGGMYIINDDEILRFEYCREIKRELEEEKLNDTFGDFGQYIELEPYIKEINKGNNIRLEM